MVYQSIRFHCGRQSLLLWHMSPGFLLKKFVPLETVNKMNAVINEIMVQVPVNQSHPPPRKIARPTVVIILLSHTEQSDDVIQIVICICGIYQIK